MPTCGRTCPPGQRPAYQRARADGIVAARSLTKIRVQLVQGRPPRDAKKCRATTVLGATAVTLITRNASS